jgi:predicted nucleic acid binding AN1-type Zn finger protein
MAKCSICKKNVGILGFECKCSGTFCDKHRLMETHQCPSLLVKSNVVLIKTIADKIKNRI